MVKIYLKQAWVLLKQNPLFSTLYIVGTGLAIAMTMIVAVIYYVKVAPVYPEVNRMQTLYLTSASFQKGTEQNKQTFQWAVSYQLTVQHQTVFICSNINSNRIPERT